MSTARPALLLFTSALLTAQAPPAPKGPALELGEALSIGIGERQADFGDVATEAPLGSLAELVWLRLEGDEWASRDIRFKCTGELGALRCSRSGGHGKLTLGKALEEGCDLAFLDWARWSMQRWTEESGEGSARARVEEGFRPFLGRRMPPGDALPLLGPEWVGQGNLLRATPKLLIQWMLDPINNGLSEQAMRHLRPIGGLLSRQGVDWWFKTGGVPGPDPNASTIWVIGSDGQSWAALRLPKGRTKAEALARFKALMGRPK